MSILDRALARFGYSRGSGDLDATDSLKGSLDLHQKASASNRVIVLNLNRDGGTIPPEKQNFKTFADLGFQQSAIVYSCIGVRARTAARLPWVLYQRPRAKGAQPRKFMTTAMATKAWASGKPHMRKAVELAEVDDHRLLRLLERPNPKQGQSAFFESLYAYRLIAGNNYLEKVAPSTGPNKGVPMELYNLRPDRVRIVPVDPRQASLALIAGYVYTINDKKQEFEPADVIHSKFFHPLDDFYGLSPLKVAALLIATDHSAHRWNHALIHNDARPSGALVAQGNVDEDVFERVKSEIKEGYSGPSGAHLPMFLEGGVDWKQITLSPIELDFLASLKHLRVEVCSILGTPPELVGDAEHKTYNSFPEARASFHNETVLPDAEAIRDDLNNELTPAFGDDLYLDIDRDQVDAIQEDRAKVWARVQAAEFITVNEKRIATGYDEIDGGDVLGIDMGVTDLLLGADADRQRPAPTAEIPDPEHPEDPEVDPEAEPKPPAAKAVKAAALTPTQRTALKRMRARLRSHFGAQGKALARYLEANLKDQL